MNPATTSSHIDEQSNLPVARIDAQEEELVLPVREYLETNGCQVIINSSSTQSVTYHIATGDIGFVKSIFSSDIPPLVKRLGIIQGVADEDAIKALSLQNKIVLIDPIHLTTSDVVEIFSFFFSGNEHVYDKRRNLHEQASNTDNPRSTGAGLTSDQKNTTVIEHESLSENQPTHNTVGSEIITTDDVTTSDRSRIGHLISDVYNEEGDTSGDETIQEKTGKRRRRKTKKSLVMVIGFGCLLLLLPVIWYGMTMAATAASFAFETKNIQKGNINQATQYQRMAVYWLHQSSFAFGLASAPFRLTGADTLVRGQERLISFFSDVSSALDGTLTISQSGKEVAAQLLATQSVEQNSTPALAMNQLHLSVTSVVGTLGLAQAELTTLIRDRTFPFSVSFIGAAAKNAEYSIIRLRDAFTYVNQMLTLYPLISGYKEPRTYLLLLQNSNELRPTGGFIGSVGLMKFDTGALSDFGIQDVYALDGQLKGHVDPPGPLKDIMNTEHWYLRDSNWDPDFKQSATRSAWFYEKESGTPVDGVIAINVPFVIDLLRVTGPITLSDYQDQISADNFFGKSLYYTQHDFFPGSTQKSDFLGSLTRTLITKITSDKSLNPILVFRAIANALVRKDIQLMFVNPGVQELIEHYGWGGRIFATSGCEGVERGTCSFDPAAVVEANLSVSKVNYFVKRTVAREITIAPDGSLSESLSLTVKNTANTVPADKVQGLGGSYVAYLRGFFSAGSTINDVSYDGTPLHSRTPKEKILPKVPYIENTDAPVGARGIGIAVSIPPGTEHTIRISLSRTGAVVFGRGGAVLDVLNYKHPGISDETVQTIVRYPLYWVANDESASLSGYVSSIISTEHEGTRTFVAKSGQLEYNSTILQDQLIRIRFIK